MVHLPRIMFAAPASGSGKTMITCGILQNFVDRGLHPASFKCGPDYIDPMFHTRVIGAESRNLDTFFTEDKVTRYLFARTAAKAGISVMEGVMGIYDGLGGLSVKASSYDLAAVTDTPVILIVNARGMSLSVIPLIQGYVEYEKQFGKRVIQGVILNQMSGMTYRHLKEQIEQQAGVRTFGYVPRLDDCVIESRHLGLVTPDEISDLHQKLEHLSRELDQCLEIKGILALADQSSDYAEEELQLPKDVETELQPSNGMDEVSRSSNGLTDCCIKTQTKDNKAVSRVRVAVAMDEAFCFYYRDNLDLLEQLGAEIVPFSPLRDSSLPENASAFLLGGGYPELYARQLSENSEMKNQILKAIRQGMPYLAECGGFMYLHDEMEDMEGHSWPMCGVISGRAFRTKKLSRFGYITLTRQRDAEPTGSEKASENIGGSDLCFLQGQTIHGHEFHYFDSDNPGSDYLAEKPNSSRHWTCIHADWQSVAGYPHLYYWSNPQFAAVFVECAKRYQKQKQMILG